MATAKKLTRKELKKPDEFVQTGKSAVDWMSEHLKLVSMITGAIFVVGLGIGIGTWWHQSHAQEAAGALGNALEIGQRQIAKSPAAKNAATEPTFPTEAARDAAFRKALQGVESKYPGSAAAAEAALQIGNLDYRTGKYDEAIKAYQRYVARAAATAPFRFAALEGIGLSYEAKGEQKKALSAYEDLEKKGNAFYKPYAMVHEARLLAALGKPEQAREKAQAVVDQFGTSPARTDAESVLGGLPPAPEKPAAKAKAKAAPAAKPAAKKDG